MTTRSLSAAVNNDWVIIMDAAKCEVTNVWRLDCYPLEHIFTLQIKSNILLSVAVDEYNFIFNGDVQIVD